MACDLRCFICWPACDPALPHPVSLCWFDLLVGTNTRHGSVCFGTCYCYIAADGSRPGVHMQDSGLMGDKAGG
jgi:hypothetical protein